MYMYTHLQENQHRDEIEVFGDTEMFDMTVTTNISTDVDTPVVRLEHQPDTNLTVCLALHV